MTFRPALSLLGLLAAAPLAAAPPYIARIDLPVPGATHAAAGDLDGDGILDLAAVADQSARLYVHYGRGDGSFRFPPEIYVTDRNPAFVAIGDLTDDGVTGFPDLLVVTRQGTIPSVPSVNGDLTVFHNSGAPPASATPRFQTSCSDMFLDGSGNRNGNQPGFALLHDFNADLLLDIVATSEFGNSIGTLFQGYDSVDPNCRATSVCNFGFAKSTNCSPVSTGRVNPQALAVGMFLPRVNTVGRWDVVSLNTGPGQPWISYHLHLNANYDAFSTVPSQTRPVGNGTTSGLGATMMASDDFNGDAVPDLVVAASLSDQISVLQALNPGALSSPAFSEPSVEFPAGDNPVWVATGDFPAGSATDPARDVTVANHNVDSVGVLPAPRADATFLAPMCHPAGDGPRVVSVHDFNNDGFEDLMVVNDIAGSVSILLGRLLPNAGFDLAYRRSTGFASDALVAGDWNGDLKPDLAVLGGAPGEVRTYLGDGTARFEELWNRTMVGVQPTALVAGRLDAGTSDDVVALSPASGEAHVLLAVGDGTLRPGSILAVPAGTSSLAAAPLDSGSTVDLAFLVPAPATLKLFPGLGDGSFAPAQDLALSGAPTGLLAASFNAAAGNDLALLDPAAGTVTILANDGAGVFTAGGAVSTGAASPNAFAAGELTGDASTDIVVTHDGGEVVVLVGDGLGGLSARPPVVMVGRPTAPLVGEFTGAGSRDVLLLLSDSDVAMVLPWESGLQNLVPSLGWSYGTGIRPQAAVAAAFDSAAASLDTIAIADSSDAPDTWGLTVLSGRRHAQYPHADAGPDRAICTGAAPVSIGTPPRCNLDYAWTPSSGLSDPTSPQPVVTGSGGTYTLTVSSPSTGFQSTDSVTVTVSPAPTPRITPDPAAYCAGAAPLVLDAGSGYAAYRWSTGETTRTIAVNPGADTLYSVTVWNSAGCSGSANRNVTVTPAPTLVADVVPLSQCQGTPSTVFQADASGSSVPAPATLAHAWSLVGALGGWSIGTPTAATTSVTATAPFSPATVTLRLILTASPGGCVTSRDFPLEVLPSGSSAPIGNTLMARAIAGGAELQWTPNGAGAYDVYGVTGKSAIATMIQPANLLSTVAAPPAQHLTADALRFYQVEGSCP